jgi:intracellular septation protein
MKAAIIALLLISFISLLIMKYKKLKLSYITLLGYLVLLGFGSLTIYTDDTFFIKIKPTIINLLFASILLIDRFKEPSKKLICKAIPLLSEIPVAKLNKMIIFWSLYFAFCALLNELVWRNFDEEFWVYFKVFGLMGVNLVFFIINFILLRSNLEDNLNGRNIKVRE